MEEQRERALEEVEKLGAKAAEELAGRLREIAGDDPESSLRLFQAYISGVRKGYKRLYAQKRKLIRIHLAPKWTLAFEAAKQYSYSRGWIEEPRDTLFARFCVITVIQNILKRLRQEDAEFARMARESEQSEEESDKSRESEKDSQR